MNIDFVTQACKNVIDDAAGFDVTFNDVKKMLENNLPVAYELSNVYKIDNEEYVFFDTCDSDRICDLFANYIGHNSWPLYGHAGTAFMFDFERKLKIYQEGIV